VEVPKLQEVSMHTNVKKILHPMVTVFGLIGYLKRVEVFVWFTDPRILSKIDVGYGTYGRLTFCYIHSL